MTNFKRELSEAFEGRFGDTHGEFTVQDKKHLMQMVNWAAHFALDSAKIACLGASSKIRIADLQEGLVE